MKKTGDTMLLLLLLLLPLLLLLLLLLLLISESWMKYWRSRLTSPHLIMTRLGTSSDEDGARTSAQLSAGATCRGGGG